MRFGQGEGLLRELGMPELIATSEDDYIRIALEMVNDPALREARRATIRGKMAAKPPFLDSRTFAAQAAELFERLVREAAESR